VINSYRDAKGKLTEATIRKNLGGSDLDLEPRRAHRYSLAKIEYNSSAAEDERGLYGETGQPLFINKLFEWKDQADLNIQREMDRLEQDFLETFGGSKPKGRQIGITAGKLGNNAKTRILQKAMNLYIDSGDKTPHLKFVRKYMHELEAKDKLSNIEKDRLGIIKRMLEMTDAEKAWADNNIRVWYDDMYESAQKRGIIDHYVNGYVKRAWRVPKDHHVVGAANSGQTSGSFANFKLTTARKESRSFNSIIDAWRDSEGWHLKNDAVLSNLATYMNEINEVATNKRFIDYMKGLPGPDGNSVIQEGLTKKQAIDLNYVELNARGFAPIGKTVYAREDVAILLNKITKEGTSGVWEVPVLKHIIELGSKIKGSVLSVSVFHHFAGFRSWIYGVHRGTKNPWKAQREGLRKLQSGEELTFETKNTEYTLGPIADLLVSNGLTIGKIQDWDQGNLRADKSWIENLLLPRTGKFSEKALQTKRFLRHGREKWSRSLFNRLFAGLKVEAGAVELQNAIKTQEKKKGRRLTSAEIKTEAQKVARLINADFGGLHLKRMGRNPDIHWCCRVE
jgi:hypothetical protein